MWKRRLLLVLATLPLQAVIVANFFVERRPIPPPPAAPTPGVTVANFRLLERGMSEAKVRTLLGGPERVEPDPRPYRPVRMFWKEQDIRIELSLTDWEQVNHLLGGTLTWEGSGKKEGLK